VEPDRFELLDSQKSLMSRNIGRYRAHKVDAVPGLTEPRALIISRVRVTRHNGDLEAGILLGCAALEDPACRCC
jgi:hypothetical protein